MIYQLLGLTGKTQGENIEAIACIQTTVAEPQSKVEIVYKGKILAVTVPLRDINKLWSHARPINEKFR